MATPCPSCNKLCSLEMQEPEIQDELTVEVEADEENSSFTFTVSGSIRIVRNSECCGMEMKEATFDISHETTLTTDEVPATIVTNKDYELTVEEDGIDQIEEGGGRYKKSFFGASVNFIVKVNDAEVYRAEWSDKIAASGMDEMN